MKKRLFITALLFWSFSVHAAEDYMSVFQTIFEEIKVRTFLEFGYSYSTEEFLKESKKVITVEFITNGYGPGGLKNYLQLFKDKANWIPISYFTGYQGDTNYAPYKYFGTEKVYRAISYHCATELNYALIDPSYLTELSEFITNLAKSNKIDVAFVNSIGYVRGDLVQILFNKVPIIVGNTTIFRANGLKDDVYGYCRVKTPENYEEIYINTEYGATIWIKKEEKFEDLIRQFKELK